MTGSTTFAIADAVGAERLSAGGGLESWVSDETEPHVSWAETIQAQSIQFRIDMPMTPRFRPLFSTCAAAPERSYQMVESIRDPRFLEHNPANAAIFTQRWRGVAAAAGERWTLRGAGGRIEPRFEPVEATCAVRDFGVQLRSAG
jgi:hypothetical protein